MGIEEAEQFQAALDAMVCRQGQSVRIMLDHDADVTDLTKNVDVRVFEDTTSEFRLFSIRRADWLHDLLGDDQSTGTEIDWPGKARGTFGLYCTGGPLIVVREITPDVVVRAVNQFLLLERGDGLTT